MGVGKTTIGKKLAKLLNYNFVDTDDLFEKKYKLSIEVFFSKYGEKLFREFESKILESTFELDNTIIATGGGTPFYSDAMDKINNSGTSVYLEMPCDEIVKRLEKSIKPRPLVKGKSHNELIVAVEKLLSQRLGTYEKAHIKFNVSTPDIDRLREILATRK